MDKAKKKFGKNIQSFFRSNDNAEVDDEDVFAELTKSGTPELNLTAIISKETTNKPTPRKDTTENQVISQTSIEAKKSDEQNVTYNFDNVKACIADKLSVSLLKPKFEKVIIEPKLRESDKQPNEALNKIESPKINVKDRISQIEKNKESKINDEADTLQLLHAKINKKKFESTLKQELNETDVTRLEKEKKELDLRQNNINKIFYSLKDSENVDICFLVDCTGSMECAIVYVKNTIHKITERLKQAFRDLNLRCAFVGYRDIGDGAERVTVLPFTKDINSFKAFVSRVESNSGDDECEDVFGGLEEVGKLDWNKMTRVLFHVADAPCHGRRFHFGAVDSYPDGDPHTVATSISKSITRSKNLSFYGGFTLQVKPLKISPITWTDSSFKSHKVTHLVPIKPNSIDEVKKKVKYARRDLTVMIANQPFDKGSIRYAFAAYVIDPSTGVERKYVAKETLFTDEKYNKREFYEDIVENQIIASYLAEEFFKISKSEKLVRFLDVNLIETKENGKYYSLEEFIDGEFVKWTNNAGYVNKETDTSFLNAFAHWTYQITNECLILTDLQGFESEKEYLLTDPAITCTEGFDRFTNTNLGIKGIKKFFDTHKCNSICKLLGLKFHIYQLDLVKA